MEEYPVSDFGRSVIVSLNEEPLFRMAELNPKLSRRVARLRKAVEARAEAALAFPYVLTCKVDDAAMIRSGMKERTIFKFIPYHGPITQ